MRYFIIPVLLLAIIISADAQKRPLDMNSYKNWPEIYQNTIRISDDGKFVAYVQHLKETGEKIIIKTSNGTLIKVLNKPKGEYGFLPNSNKLIYSNGNDSLNILDPVLLTTQILPGYSKYKTSESDINQWLFCYSDIKKNIMFFNAKTNKEIVYQNVIDFRLSKDILKILTITKSKIDSNSYSLLLNSVVDETTNEIYSGHQPSNLTISDNGTKMAFITDGNDIENKKIHIYNQNNGKTKTLPIASEIKSNEWVFSERNLQFSEDGNKIFFYTKPIETLLPKNKELACVDIWNYKDFNLKSFQLSSLNGPAKSIFSAFIKLDQAPTFVKIHENFEREIGYDVLDFNNNFSLLYSDQVDYRNVPVYVFYFVNMKNGFKQKLPNNNFLSRPYLSKYGEYILWFDAEKHNWFTYSRKSGKTSNITGRIHSNFSKIDDRVNLHGAAEDGSHVRWLDQDQSVLIYDNFDLWKIDPNGIKKSENLTHGYGKKHKIRFRLLEFQNESPIKLDTLLLSAIDQKTMRMGFYQLVTSNSKNLKKLSLFSKNPGVRTYDDLMGSADEHLNLNPQKARNSKTYLLSISSATEFPNLFLTTDFTKFTSLSNLNPQAKYNWFTTQLITWKLPNHNFNHGILYKPENFDPTKKYPIIFYYYEQNSFSLNTYLYPDLSNGRLNIPWYVSNGYLVFVPDIFNYTKGHPGFDACQTVVSAAKYLSQFTWIDQKHIGLQGHSYGGTETNYIVTHTNIFAAAAPASAVDNLVNAYSMEHAGYFESFYETGQGRIGAPLGLRPDLYIENSPIFRVNKANTPLLILHNKDDKSVLWNQAFEWFTNLKRMSKKVWLLQYDSERHTLFSEKNQLDYSIRLSQFFDYYLKGKPAPIWMTKGISINEKQIQSGLEYDLSVQL